MSSATETQAYETDAELDTLLAILRDPTRIPLWAPAFADSVTGDAETGWRVAKGDRAFALRVAVGAEARTVDYLREVAPGREGGAYLRVLPRPRGGSVVVMTLPIPPDTEPATVAKTLSEELVALARLAEQVR